MKSNPTIFKRRGVVFLFIMMVLAIMKDNGCCHGLQFLPIINTGDLRSAWHHLWDANEHHGTLVKKSTSSTVQDLANTAIPRRDGGTVLAYQTPTTGNDNQQQQPLLILLHEFFGLSQSICDKADALARDLQCTVIAPDTFRGDSSTFIPKCIWLALSTPQIRVNQDLDDVVQYYYDRTDNDQRQLAVMGFCYGGGKAIRYTTTCQPTAATVVCYGSPLTDVHQLQRLQKPVCGVFGQDDLQFPPPLLEKFEDALKQAVPDYNLQVYPGVGHAFWKDMEQIQQKQQPQYDAYQQVVTFLQEHL